MTEYNVQIKWDKESSSYSLKWIDPVSRKGLMICEQKGELESLYKKLKEWDAEFNDKT